MRQGLELKRKPLEAVPDAVEFILDRVEPVLLADGVTVEEVRAARGAGHVAPVPLAALAFALRDDRGSQRLESLRDAFGRCTRIVTKSEDELAVNFDQMLLRDPPSISYWRRCARRTSRWPTASRGATTPARWRRRPTWSRRSTTSSSRCW